MSLHDARMPSLRDRIEAEARELALEQLEEATKEGEVEVKKKKKIIKRLN